MMRFLPHLHPITRQRLHRFRRMRRAWWSFWILSALYLCSLASELLSNERPLYARVQGRSFFPAFFFYSEKDVTGEGADTRANFKAIQAGPFFHRERGDRIVFAPHPHGPLEIATAESLPLADTITVFFRPDARVGALWLDASGRVTRVLGPPDLGLPASGALVQELGEVTPLHAALARRFANESAEEIGVELSSPGRPTLRSFLAAFEPRAAAPREIRLSLRLPAELAMERQQMTFDRGDQVLGRPAPLWAKLDEATRARIVAAVKDSRDRLVPGIPVVVEGARYATDIKREAIRFPFRPCAGHPLGLDDSGRDVLARILYGTRVSLTFGFVLVAVAMIVGTVFGGIQGFFGGRVDLTGQRLIEIWAALPFLYIIILMGSVFGRSFGLLVLVDALFGWIGISQYMRSEFLRLRKWPFVEAAQTQGLSTPRIMFGHILPNALVPLVTFFPFSLVGAIGLLAALDYLGFGLPPPTPSWGEMLHQAQNYLWAWWLIIYPTIALFLVMLLCVFVGEGLRAAFDPKSYSKLE